MIYKNIFSNVFHYKQLFVDTIDKSITEINFYINIHICFPFYQIHLFLLHSFF